MPPSKGKGPTSMGDHIQRILHEIADAELSGDADHDFLNQLRTQIIGYHQSVAQGGQPGQGQPGQAPPGMGGLAGQMQQAGQGMQGPPGAPPGMPTVDGEGLSRGPNPNPDMSGASGELQRIMSGA